MKVQNLRVSLGKTGREAVSRGVAGFLDLSDWRPFVSWGLCPLLCGFLQQGLGAWGWCVEGDGWLGFFLGSEDLAEKMWDQEMTSEKLK